MKADDAHEHIPIDKVTTLVKNQTLMQNYELCGVCDLDLVLRTDGDVVVSENGDVVSVSRNVQ